MENSEEAPAEILWNVESSRPSATIGDFFGGLP